LEKPKWKPPPVVRAPTPDEDDEIKGGEKVKDEGEGEKIGVEGSARSGGVAGESVDETTKEAVGGSAEAAQSGEGGEEGASEAVDPAEEERQRRANIAARMAKLGGARVGMAPPMFGAKPPVPAKKPSLPMKRESLDGGSAAPAKVEEKASEQVNAPVIESQTTEEPGSIKKEAETGAPPQEHKSTTESVDTPSLPGSRTPTSMPVPAGPRRAAPPRKKAAKTPTPPAAQAHAVAEGDEAPEDVLPETKEAVSLSDKGAVAGTVTAETTVEPEPEPAEEPAKVEEEPKMVAEVLVSELKAVPEGSYPEATEEITKLEKLENEAVDAHNEEGGAGLTTGEEREEEHHAEPALDEEVGNNEPRTASVEDTDHGIEQEPASEPQSEAPEPEPENEPEIAPEPAPAAEEHGEQDEAEEEEAARRKRIAEKLEKMGGFNPFAARSTPPRVHSREGTNVEGTDTPASGSGLAKEEAVDDMAAVPGQEGEEEEVPKAYVPAPKRQSTAGSVRREVIPVPEAQEQEHGTKKEEKEYEDGE
jgi:hypothetical protein